MTKSDLSVIPVAELEEFLAAGPPQCQCSWYFRTLERRQRRCRRPSAYRVSWPCERCARQHRAFMCRRCWRLARLSQVFSRASSSCGGLIEELGLS
jgi:hypothetical protein